MKKDDMVYIIRYDDDAQQETMTLKGCLDCVNNYYKNDDKVINYMDKSGRHIKMV